ncbi:hypothetical protein LTR97_011070 [Elasticomyces elasticus]|uniref:Extracellular membrane protein CFEM domain-containing protein n=1 Tax=Elasticomyces elasticus TaxID=574655 RepID=A0AAN7ZW01_9PEZI|nr:hypothetical protein LTR97_011070 [Elasticomyces elasticus]
MVLLAVLQLVLTMLLLNVSGVIGQTNTTAPSACTNACWFKTIIQSGCIGDDETQCMCTSYDNYLAFYNCNLICFFQKDGFTGLNSDMECIGYKKRARDIATTSAVPASTPSAELPAPTTFETRVKRAPDAQTAALTPWQPLVAKPKPLWSSYTAGGNIPAHTIWYCGVPGAACGEYTVGSETQPDVFRDSDDNSAETTTTVTVEATATASAAEKRDDYSKLVSAISAFAQSQEYARTHVLQPPKRAEATATQDLSGILSALSVIAHGEAPTSTPLVGVFTYTGGPPLTDNKRGGSTVSMAVPSDIVADGHTLPTGYPPRITSDVGHSIMATGHPPLITEEPVAISSTITNVDGLTSASSTTTSTKRLRNPHIPTPVPDMCEMGGICAGAQ